MREVRRAVRVAAAPADVWAAATTVAGINDELWPVLRMTPPPLLGERTVAEVQPGSHLGRSTLLLGGVLPVDYDDITVAELEPGRRFLERSSMRLLSRWEHERVLTPAGPGHTLVEDRLAFEPRPLVRRVPGIGAVVVAVVSALFAHRHRRLVRRWGAGQGDPA